MILLDTDHLTVLADTNHSLHGQLIARMTACHDVKFVACAVSLEEQMRGWLAEVHRQRRVHAQVRPYAKLTDLIWFFSKWTILQFDARAADRFAQLRAGRVRIGAQDLKIASIALTNAATLLSSNAVDFDKVPGLQTEDWLHASQ